MDKSFIEIFSKFNDIEKMSSSIESEEISKLIFGSSLLISLLSDPLLTLYSSDLISIVGPVNAVVTTWSCLLAIKLSGSIIKESLLTSRKTSLFVSNANGAQDERKITVKANINLFIFTCI